MPLAVQQTASGAVKVEYEYDSHDSYSSVEGSGLKIGPGLVLTAGHVVLKGNPDNDLECAGSSVLSTLAGRHSYGSWRHQILNRKAVYNTSNYTAGKDVAVLSVQRNANFDGLPTARIAANPPVNGETVFFINYETGGSDSRVDHYPYIGSTGQTLFKGGNYDHPAEYAGTMIGRQGPYILVATGEAGYGPRAGREVNSYPGGSGGEVLNSAGRLIGEVIATGVSENISQISNYNGVQLTADPNTRQISIVQPVTKAILKPIIDSLPQTPVC